MVNLSTDNFVLVSDASFATAKGLKILLGFVILITNYKGDDNLVHYGSSRCKRVTRSVTAAEVHGITLGLDFAYIAHDLLHEIIRRETGIDAYVEIKTLFDVVAKDGAQPNVDCKSASWKSVKDTETAN